MTKIATRLMVGLMLGGAWGGCKKADSTTARTSEIFAELLVTEHSASEATVDASLRIGDALSPTYLRLTGEDRLTVYIGTAVYPMQGYSDVNQHYVATIPYPATDTELRVDFERGADDVSAPGSTVIVPGFFALTAMAPTAYSRARDSLEIDWAPFDPAQQVSWLIYGSCVQTLSGDRVADSGRVTLPAGTLQKPPPPGPDEEHHPIPPDQCSPTVDVTKARVGQVDVAFKGGTFTASQSRSTSFTSVP